MKIGQIQGINFDELPCIMPRPTSVFCCFFSGFLSLKSVGTKEMAMRHNFLAFFPIKSVKKALLKCVKAATCIIDPFTKRHSLADCQSSKHCIEA